MPNNDSELDPASATAKTDDTGKISSGHRKMPGTRAALASAAVALTIAAACGWKWHDTAAELAAARHRDTDRETAARVAADYATRSLTYDYHNLDAFFTAVTTGVDPALQDRYKQVRDTLAQIMSQAQVIATGTVVATAVQADGPDRYKVTVFATQQTRNAQSPQPGTVPNLLTVTVADRDSQWQVVDYGTKTG